MFNSFRSHLNATWINMVQLGVQSTPQFPSGLPSKSGHFGVSHQIIHR